LKVKKKKNKELEKLLSRPSIIGIWQVWQGIYWVVVEV
jgi:hypothetical protein